VFFFFFLWGPHLKSVLCFGFFFNNFERKSVFFVFKTEKCFQDHYPTRPNQYPTVFNHDFLAAINCNHSHKNIDGSSVITIYVNTGSALLFFISYMQYWKLNGPPNILQQIPILTAMDTSLKLHSYIPFSMIHKRKKPCNFV
jgi:hypothetical protein